MAETIQCPGCQRQLRLPDDAADFAQCPSCGMTIEVRQASEPAPSGDPTPATAAEPGAQTAITENPVPDEGISELRTPRRSRKEILAQHEQARLSRGNQSPTDPGLLLMIFGGFIFLLACGAWIDEPILFMRAAEGGGNAYEVPSLLQAVLGLTMLVGGLHLAKRRSWTIALLGAIAAIVPLQICCVLSMPLGLWALVLLTNPKVKQEFSSS